MMTTVSVEVVVFVCWFLAADFFLLVWHSTNETVPQLKLYMVTSGAMITLMIKSHAHVPSNGIH